MKDAWYLEAGGYYTSAPEANRLPLRQGDILKGPEIDGVRWHAAQLVHPTCELGKSAVKSFQIVRVRPLSDLDDDYLRQLVVAGYTEDRGQFRVAVAHTFFLPPWGAGEEPCFASFRDLRNVSRADFESLDRVAAITHECRVTFVRRWLYFRFRLQFSYEDVRAWEAARIGADPNFRGPRPDWAA